MSLISPAPAGVHAGGGPAPLCRDDGTLNEREETARGLPVPHERDATLGTAGDFRIVSEAGDTVWDRLSENRRLDFDLCVQHPDQRLSFDLAASFREDFYPTATQFHAMQQRRRREFGDRTLRDLAVRVGNGELRGPQRGLQAVR